MASTKGRKPGFRMSDEHRLKIQNSNILNALIEFTKGERDMTPAQASTGVALLRKIMPDLKSVEVKGDEEAPLVMRVVIGGDD